MWFVKNDLVRKIKKNSTKKVEFYVVYLFLENYFVLRTASLIRDAFPFKSLK